MSGVMARYAASGQTQAAFCAGEGLKVATFQYWWRRYRLAQGELGGGFVALEPAGEATVPGVELHYREVRLQLGSVSASYVAELVRQLTGPC
jgi:hypothetical protein